MLNNIKIGPKLLAAFITISLIGGVIGLIGITNIQKISKNDMELYEKCTSSIADLMVCAVNFQKVRVLLQEMVTFNSPAEVDARWNKVGGLSQDADNHLKAYEGKLISEEDRLLLKKYVDTKGEYLNSAGKFMALIKGQKFREAAEFMNGEGIKTSQIHQAAVDEILDFKVKKAKEYSDHNIVISGNSMTIMIMITMIGIILAVIVGLVLTVSITKPLGVITHGVKLISKGDIQLKSMNRNEINKAKSRKDELGIISNALHELIEYIQEKEQIAKTISEGDLVVEPKVASNEDDFGKAYKNMVASLNELLSQVTASVEQVSGGSGQVSAASQELSQGAAEQASSLEEITSSVTEIGSQTKQNTDNAIMVNGLAKDAKEKAEQGNTQMKDLVAAMAEINKSADEIKKIVKAIDDIAFQINLLALNANVEAARAGKYGKGFAVVAEEVRNLAVRSANSVKETNQMVEDAIRAIGNGNHLVEVTSKQLKEIVDGSAKVADIAAEVATASKEQTQGLDQISTGLGQIDQVTQQNTASAEECASASEELASQAQQLKSMISRFRLKESTTIKNDSVSTELIQKIKSELAREQNMKVEHLQLQQGKEKTPVAEKKVVNPKDVIKLDDDNFGKF